MVVAFHLRLANNPCEAARTIYQLPVWVCYQRVAAAAAVVVQALHGSSPSEEVAEVAGCQQGLREVAEVAGQVRQEAAERAAPV
jgi:hypothetical protein